MGLLDNLTKEEFEKLFKKTDTHPDECGYCGMKLNDPKHNKKECDNEAEEYIRNMDEALRKKQ